MISIFLQCLLSELTNLFWGHFDVTKLIPNTVEDDCIHKTSSFKLEAANFIVSISFLLVNYSVSVEKTEQFCLLAQWHTVTEVDGALSHFLWLGP